MINPDSGNHLWLSIPLTDEEAHDLEQWAEEHQADLDELVHQALLEAMAS